MTPSREPKNAVSDVTLHTERLTLRELVDSDFDAVHAYAVDPVVVRYMPWGPNSPPETREFLTRAQEAAAATPRLGYELAVTLRSDGTLLGAMGLHRDDPDVSEAMLGYCFGQEAWGHGYATEAGHAVMRFAFGPLQLASVWAGCNADNTGSIRVLEKLGFTLRSRHREEPATPGISDESLMFRLDADTWASSG